MDVNNLDAGPAILRGLVNSNKNACKLANSLYKNIKEWPVKSHFEKIKKEIESADWVALVNSAVEECLKAQQVNMLESVKEQAKYYNIGHGLMKAVKQAYEKTVFKEKPAKLNRPQFVPLFEDIDKNVHSGIVLHDALNDRSFVAPAELTFKDVIDMQAEPSRRREVQ